MAGQVLDQLGQVLDQLVGVQVLDLADATAASDGMEKDKRGAARLMDSSGRRSRHGNFRAKPFGTQVAVGIYTLRSRR